MNPFSAVTGIAGLGLEIYGGLEQANAAKQEAEISRQELRTEQEQDNVRRSAMEFAADRERTQQVRNMQVARAQATVAAVAGGQSAQGGQRSSGLQGVIGGISGQGNLNIFNTNVAEEQSEKMFDLNAQLNSLKQSMTKYQTQGAQGAGIAGIGGGLMGLGKLFG